jgi:uncharacterized OsmC-like protein
MTTVKVNIHSADGITTEIVGRGQGRMTAERTPRIGTHNGMGYGGGEILCMAAATCFYNNLRRLANDSGIVLKTLQVEVVAETSDASPMTREVILKPTIESDASESALRGLIDRALQESYVADMLTHSVSVKLASLNGAE